MTIKGSKSAAEVEAGAEAVEGTAHDSEACVSIEAGRSATTAAIRAARGVVIRGRLDSVLVQGGARPVEGVTSLTQTLDAVALEVKGLLGRMRHLASLSFSDDVATDERAVIQDEFAMLQVHLDRVTQSVEAGVSKIGSSFSVTEGRGQPAHEFYGRLTAKALGVDVTVATVISAEDAEWALVRIDAAEQLVSQIRNEFGTVEERIDAALDELRQFVKNISPPGAHVGSASDVYAAAERVRLQIMQEAGVSSVGQTKGLPKGVSPLLQ